MISISRFRINDTRKGGTDSVLYLNGGDSFQGTPWFSVYRGKMVAQMLNFLSPDAMVEVFKLNIICNY